MLKSFAKLSIFIAIFPVYLTYKLHLLFSKDRDCFPAYSQFLAQFPGKFGSYMRVQFYKLSLDQCDESCFIGYGTILSTARVKIDANVYIGNYCCIGSVEIGENVMLASRVSLISGSKQHGYELSNKPYREQPGIFQQIKIGSNCWVGEGSLVAANLGKNVIVGAGAVVLKDIADNMKAIGNPAKILPISADE